MKNTANSFNRPYTEPKLNWVYVMLPLLFLMLIGCSKDETDPPTDKIGAYNTRTMQHDGVERTYHMYLPNNFDKSVPTPLVFALHGGGGTGVNFEGNVSAGTLTTAADSRGVILLMPEGMDKRWNDGRPEIFGNDIMYDDVGFISAIIDKMVQDYGVDSKRVYATGISNGGFMSIRLAMDLSDKITAIAPVTAQISAAIQSKVPEFPIAVMFVNGVDDPLVPYDGGCITVPLTPVCSRGEVLSTQESVEKFIGYNQCTTPPLTEPVIDTVPNDGTSVEITAYKGCEQGTEVVLVKVIGGGHTWPSGEQYLPVNVVGAVSMEINASEMILDFFLN